MKRVFCLIIVLTFSCTILAQGNITVVSPNGGDGSGGNLGVNGVSGSSFGYAWEKGYLASGGGGGGAGEDGNGGGGGPSIGIVSDGSTFVAMGNVYNIGPGGSGGASAGNQGVNGMSTSNHSL